MRLYFVRHGQTDYNLKSAYYGWSDIGLNSCGRAQAARLSDMLAGLYFDRIWTSDMKRVTETVDIILKSDVGKQHAENPVKADVKKSILQRRSFSDFREMNFGKWEGLNYSEIRETFPKDFKRWSADWKCAPPTGGECFAQFYARVKKCFEALISEDDGSERPCGADGTKADNRQILVAAHNGTLRILFAVMMGLSMDGTWHFNFEQDAYSVVDYEYNNFTVRKINSREKACPVFGRN